MIGPLVCVTRNGFITFPLYTINQNSCAIEHNNIFKIKKLLNNFLKYIVSLKYKIFRKTFTFTYQILWTIVYNYFKVYAPFFYFLKETTQFFKGNVHVWEILEINTSFDIFLFSNTY